MPPKKQEEEIPSKTLLPVFVLPIFDSIENPARSILSSKPINLKKTIDQQRIIDSLRGKGLEQYMNERGEISDEGHNFICENMKAVSEDFVAQISKPADSKKDGAKKDAKKDPKKEEVAVEESSEPLTELDFKRECSEFIFYMDFPRSVEQLQKFIESGPQLDIVVIINQKVKKGSRKPDFQLLNQKYEEDELMGALDRTTVDQVNGSPQDRGNGTGATNRRMKECLQRAKSESDRLNCLVVTEVHFENDLSNPEADEKSFIDRVFEELCSVTVDRVDFEEWRTKAEVRPMIEPLKQTIRKEVEVESQDKKGKKDPSKQPEVQVVEEVIETKYETVPENIKSDLTHYYRIATLNKTPSDAPNGQVLINCINGAEMSRGATARGFDASKVSQSIDKKLQHLQSRPTARRNCLKNLKQNQREVLSFSNSSAVYDFVCPSRKLSRSITFEEILHRDPTRKNVLETEYVIRQFQGLMRSEQPKIQWDFSDRHYREKLSKEDILSAIYSDLQSDPQAFQATIDQDGLKLLCLAKLNPPGRTLFSNSFFEQRTLPSFEEWRRSFKGKGTERNSFFDYKFEDAGNLWIKEQRLMPADNAVISVQLLNAGNEQQRINYFQKQDCLYGLRQESEGNTFWSYHKSQKMKVSVLQRGKKYIKTVKVQRQATQEESEQTQLQQQETTSEETHQRSQFWVETQSYKLGNDPYPKVVWKSKKWNSEELWREFGPKGEVSSYLRDGSVRIMYRNGDTSTFKNQQWVHIKGTLQTTFPSQESVELQVQQFVEGEKTIRVREDQTRFIEMANGNSLIAFVDGTQVFTKAHSSSYEIKSRHPETAEEIVVRLTLPRSKNWNVIGHGSAFSYLGFHNILERSYDGFLFEVWSCNLSSHLYIEKFEHEGRTIQEEVRVVHLSDGTVLKVEGCQGRVTFIQGTQGNSGFSEWKWNQLFTSEDNLEQGVYLFDLQQGFAKTTDSESNAFTVSVEEDPKSQIAVSFCISEDDDSANNFGPGLHVPEENYFLPPPQNSNPSLLFSFNQETQSYYQYLSQSQIQRIENPSSGYHVEEIGAAGKLVKQYCKAVDRPGSIEGIPQVPFSSSPRPEHFELPAVLRGKETRASLGIEDQPVTFRQLELIDWSRDFSNLSQIESAVEDFRRQRQEQINLLAQ